MSKFIKIVCTLGPSSDDFSSIKNLIDAGMDFARLNFSHGSYDEHQRRIDIIRALTKTGKKARTIQDLPGPKIRVGAVRGQVVLKEGAKVKLTGSASRDKETLPIMYESLAESVAAGSSILLCDGAIKLNVVDVHGDIVMCNVENGGTVISHKGVNIMGTTSKVSAITKEDIEHMRFGIGNGVDYIALSFVTKAGDIKTAKSIISKAGAKTPVIAKIEKMEALENLDSIISAADAVMVARGDLAVEIGIENLTLAQKRIIRRANALGKPVITATQMLYSMVNSRTPTRAEVSDVSNAVIDGTDGLMLSEESAVGKYPSSAVAVLNRVASRMETEPQIMTRLSKRRNEYYGSFLGSRMSQPVGMLNLAAKKPR